MSLGLLLAENHSSSWCVFKSPSVPPFFNDTHHQDLVSSCLSVQRWWWWCVAAIVVVVGGRGLVVVVVNWLFGFVSSLDFPMFGPFETKLVRDQRVSQDVFPPHKLLLESVLIGLNGFGWWNQGLKSLP